MLRPGRSVPRLAGHTAEIVLSVLQHQWGPPGDRQLRPRQPAADRAQRAVCARADGPPGGGQQCRCSITQVSGAPSDAGNQVSHGAGSMLIGCLCWCGGVLLMAGVLAGSLVLSGSIDTTARLWDVRRSGRCPVSEDRSQR